jgi:hypothetical protein
VVQTRDNSMELDPDYVGVWEKFIFHIDIKI